MRNKWVKAIFLTPHVWLAAAALSVAGSFAVDYIEAQKIADRALALRQGPPSVVALQNFDPSRHVGPAREVRVLAEASLTNPVVVNLGTSEGSRRAIMVPLFPLSDRGLENVVRDTTQGAEGQTIRPAPRPMPNATEVAVAEGMLVYLTENQLGPTVSIDALINRRFGIGRYGSVVEINGERIDPGQLAPVVIGVMAGADREIVDNYLAIAPYKHGRLVALAPPPSSGLQRALFWGGVALALGAITLSFKTVDILAGPKKRGRSSGQEQRMVPGRSDKARERFQTLPTQDELYAAEAGPSPDDAASRKLIGQVTDKLKNRR